MLNANLIAQERSRGEAIATIQKLRREARDEIARLIQFLDQSDPYVMTELEEDDDREPEVAEPSLGSLDRALDQIRWAMGSCDDGEHDNSDDEPSLGSIEPNQSACGCWTRSNFGDQTNWGRSSTNDLEKDPAESGIGDGDGLLEQVGTQDWQQGAMA